MVNSPLKLGASHLPVLASEAVAALQVDQGGVFIDCTLGRAGHSKLILSALGGSGRLICLDRDPQAIAFAQKAIGKDPRVTLVHSAFSDIDKILESHGLLDGSVDGVLLDLGVSSPQLDQAERGFSFRTDGPLDMRMDNSSGQTAAKWLAYAEVEEIADVLWRYGEERQ